MWNCSKHKKIVSSALTCFSKKCELTPYSEAEVINPGMGREQRKTMKSQ